eukprot:67096-Hanusia_phi.AAC.3
MVPDEAEMLLAMAREVEDTHVEAVMGGEELLEVRKCRLGVHIAVEGKLRLHMPPHHLLRLSVYIDRLVSLRRREEGKDPAPRPGGWPSVRSQDLEGDLGRAEPLFVPHNDRVGSCRRRPPCYPADDPILIHRQPVGERGSNVDPNAYQVRLHLLGLGLLERLEQQSMQQRAIRGNLPHALVRVLNLGLEHSSKLQPEVGTAVHPSWPAPHHCEAHGRHGALGDARDHARLLVDANPRGERGIDREARDRPAPAGDEASLGRGGGLVPVLQVSNALFEGELVAREGSGDVGVAEVMGRLEADDFHQEIRLTRSCWVRRGDRYHPHSASSWRAGDLARRDVDGEAVREVSSEEGRQGEAREEAKERRPSVHLHIVIKLDDSVSLVWTALISPSTTRAKVEGAARGPADEPVQSISLSDGTARVACHFDPPAGVPRQGAAALAAQAAAAGIAQRVGRTWLGAEVKIGRVFAFSDIVRCDQIELVMKLLLLFLQVPSQIARGLVEEESRGQPGDD